MSSIGSLALLPQGPVIDAIAWLEGERCEPKVVLPGLSESHGLIDELSMPPQLDAATGRFHWCDENKCSLPTHGDEPLDRELRRRSGVARSGSAPKSSIYAALLAKALWTAVPEKRSDGFRRMATKAGVTVASASSATAMAWAFESDGKSSGWENTDPMLLPGSLPSATATQTAAALGFHAVATAFPAGALGFQASLEYAVMQLAHGRAEHMLAIGAEESCSIQTQALRHCADERPIFGGAAGLLLSNLSNCASDDGAGIWQMHGLATCARGQERTLIQSAAQDEALITDIEFSGGRAIYTSTLLPLAIAKLLKRAEAGRSAWLCIAHAESALVSLLGFKFKPR